MLLAFSEMKCAVLARLAVAFAFAMDISLAGHTRRCIYPLPLTFHYSFKFIFMCILLIVPSSGSIWWRSLVPLLPRNVHRQTVCVCVCRNCCVRCSHPHKLCDTQTDTNRLTWGIIVRLNENMEQFLFACQFLSYDVRMCRIFLS